MVVADAAPVQDSGDASNLPTASDEVGEQVVEKPVEHATDLTSEKEKEKALPETQITSAPDTIAFRDFKDEPEVSTSANTTAPSNVPASDKPAAPVVKTTAAKPGIELLINFCYFNCIRAVVAARGVARE